MNEFEQHGTCKYLGWIKLAPWCRHPEHPEAIKPRRSLALACNGGKCDDRVDIDKKVFKDEPISWPTPINLEEVADERSEDR